MQNLFPKSRLDLVYGSIQVRQFHVVVKQGQLRRTAHQLAEAHAHEAYHHAAVVETVEEAVDRLLQHVVEGGVGDALLHVVRVEVGITDLHRHAARQLALRAQVEAEALHHPR